MHCGLDAIPLQFKHPYINMLIEVEQYIALGLADSVQAVGPCALGRENLSICQYQNCIIHKKSQGRLGGEASTSAYRISQSQKLLIILTKQHVSRHALPRCILCRCASSLLLEEHDCGIALRNLPKPHMTLHGLPKAP